MSMKAGEWHRNAKGKLVRKRGAYKTKHWTQTPEGNKKLRALAKARWARNGALEKIGRRAPEVAAAIEDALDHDSILHILDGVWKGFTLHEKLEAIHGLYFDPSNPNDE